MRTALTKLIECIVYYSTEFSEFKIQPLIKPNVLKLARGYSKDNYKIVRRNKNLVEYNGLSGSKYSLMFNSKNYHLGFGCSCPFFVKSAICSHIVGYDLVAELGIFEIESDPKTFVMKTKRGRKKSNAVVNKIGKALEKE